MKRTFTLFTAVLLTVVISAQLPEKMSYQAVIRNASDQLVINQEVGLRVSILQNSIDGTVLYQEIYNPNPETNNNGLLTIVIGAGVPLTGAFSEIDWSDGPYFLKTEIDPSGGTTYTITGTSQLLSVPYAFHSGTADILTGEITENQIADLQEYLTGETDPLFTGSPASGIEADDIDNWDEAHGWGDHAAEDYLTEEADPVFTAWDRSTGIEITESQISDLQQYLTEETDPSVPKGTDVGEMQYWNGTSWVTVAPGSPGQVLTFINGAPAWAVPGLNDVENPATGKVWMDRNLGASRVARSSTDAAAYGDLYQWGRASDGHEIRTSGTTTTLSDTDTPGHGDFIIVSEMGSLDWRSTQNDDLWQGLNGVNNPCPDGYRLPTEAEWTTERLSWSSNNAAGAFASPLKLPVAGSRNLLNGSLEDLGSGVDYWSSTVAGELSRGMNITSSIAGMRGSRRAFGYSVRCIKD